MDVEVAPHTLVVTLDLLQIDDGNANDSLNDWPEQEVAYLFQPKTHVYVD